MSLKERLRSITPYYRGNKQIPTLMPDSINPISKKIRIGISSAFSGKANDVNQILNNFSRQLRNNW